MAGSPPCASLGLGAFWAVFSIDSPAVNNYLFFTQAVYICAQTWSTLQASRLSDSVCTMKQISHTFWKQISVLQLPQLFGKKTHSSTSVNSVSGDLGNEALERIWEMRGSFAVHESPMLVLPGVPATSCQLCQCPFHWAHTSFEHLCLALTSSQDSAGWCQAGLVLWRQNDLLEMNGTPGLCSFCRRKCCNHIPFILPFPSIWSFN